ncbi:hypothetical protein [Dyella acidiphila]|uniref:DUF3108 domain-containing protein n=1 Tax=Dyella acidiphila TaxID=2775866 RepID=A0ABR9G7Y4_9GAMM|nr:hypothetical protein [Dyella acidiphila]MBE1160155.1 hypothetical protein [Dyella acidiphila]
MSRWLFAAAASLLCCTAYADSIDVPALKSGDSWVYTYTTENGQRGWSQKDEEIAVERVTGEDVLITLNQKGSNQPPAEELRGLDWSHTVDINGKQQMVSQPLSFPLHEGKKWELSFTQANPDPKLTSRTTQCKYAVTGWEDVQVPAGKFHALKVECDGQWSADLAPGVNVAQLGSATQSGTTMVSQTQRVVPHTVTGRIYRAYWYVPTVKRYVKAVEENYNGSGFRTYRLTEELDSFKPAG